MVRSGFRPGAPGWGPAGRTLAAFGLAVTIGGCSSSSDAALVGSTTTSPASTTAASSTTSTTSTLPSTSPTSIAPSTTPSTVAVASTSPVPTAAPASAGVPSDEEWVTIIETLTERIDNGYGDPANADLGSICIAESPCWFTYKTQFDDMVSKGLHHVDSPPITVLSIDGVVDLASTGGGANAVAPNVLFEVALTVAPLAPGGQVVDADGNVVYQLESTSQENVAGTRVISRYPEDSELPWRFVG